MKYLKTIFLLFVICQSAIICNAQNFQFGAFISPNINWMKAFGTDVTGSSRFGFSYGATIDYEIKETQRYFFSSGIVVKHGSSELSYINENPNDIDSISLFKLQYIDLPITFKLKTNQIGYMTFFGQVGGSFGIPIRTRRSVTYLGPDSLRPPDQKNLKAGKFLTKFNMSMIISAGMEYDLDKDTSLMAAIYFNNGFTNLIKDNDNEKVSLSHAGLRMGILF